MKISVEEIIEAPKERVWQIITDIDRTPNVLSGVKRVEVLERPQKGIKGLKWKETRQMFGKEETETMWIEDVQEQSWYEVKSESHGTEYHTRLSLEEREVGVLLRMEFEGIPKTIGAKLMSVFAKLFVNATQKALQQDLADIKAAAETQN